MNVEKFKEFGSLFYPKSIAVIGASNTHSYYFVKPLINSKLSRKVFLVNPRRKQILGVKCYPSILDIKEPIEYAIIAVSAHQTLNAVKNCIARGVKVVHVFSSGFGETGEREDVELERELSSIVRGRIRLIGPNCMGIYCSESGLFFSYDQDTESGPVGFLSQSGAQAVNFTLEGRVRNFRFSKVISYGNAVDLDFIDFIEYLGDDPKTKVIAAYIEGVRKNENLLQVLRSVARRKPVIALKGGVSEEGARAAASHTGSLAGSRKIWEAFFKQADVIQVESLEEMSDTALAFVASAIPKGNGTSIITTSGGVSVIQTDACAEAGLRLPTFTDETIKRLRKIITAAGRGCIKNPLDAWPIFVSNNLPNAMAIIASDNNVHSLILEIETEEFRCYTPITKGYFKNFVKTVIDSCRHIQNTVGKPVMVCLPPSYYADVHGELERAFQRYGLPTYPSIDRAGKALFNTHKYYQRVQQISASTIYKTL